MDRNNPTDVIFVLLIRWFHLSVGQIMFLNGSMRPTDRNNPTDILFGSYVLEYYHLLAQKIVNC